MTGPKTKGELRARLGDARLMLLFTPEMLGEREPEELLESLAGCIDVLQVRVKLGAQVGSAKEHQEWTRRILEWTRPLGEEAPLVFVNDRVDVAASLLDQGCAGVHLGQDDCPVELARETLGDDALIGLSTHSMSQVAEALTQPVDYLGFGPIHATATKGYTSGVGAEQCWVASSTAGIPVFPIGGITAQNASELATIGRAAVSSSILTAEDPRAEAEELREALES